MYFARTFVVRTETCGLLQLKNGTSWLRTRKLVCCDTTKQHDNMYMGMVVFVCEAKLWER